MIKLFAFMAALLMMSAGQAQSQTNGLANENPERGQTAGKASRVSAFPWSENFNGSAFPPAEWTKALVEGPTYPSWSQGSSWSGTTHEGSGSATQAGGSGITLSELLVTPPLEIPDEDLIFKFWSRIGYPNDYNIDTKYSEIMVSTTNTDAASFTAIKRLSGAEIADNWQEISISLDAYRGQTIYVAFHFYITGNGYSHRWTVDDVKVTAPAPSIEANALALGTVYQNLSPLVTVNYPVKNKGAMPLTVTGAADASASLTVGGEFPLSIPAGETATVPVTLNVAALSAGNFTGSFKLQSNDPETPEATVNVTAAVQATAVISGYVYQDFTETNIFRPGWTFDRFTRQGGEGIDNTPCVRVNLQFSSYYPTMAAASFTTPFIQMGADPLCMFNIQVTNQTGGTPAAADALSYKLLITTDGVNWNELVTVNQGEHVPSADYALFAPDVSTYANQLCQVRFSTSTTNSTSIYVRIDNITIGTEPDVDLAAIAIAGDSAPKEGIESIYKITVKNVGENIGNYTVKLMQDNPNGDDIELASTVITNTEIAQDDTAEIDVAWTPSTFGSVALYGKVVLANDLDETNDQTANLAVTVQPANDLAAVLVDGNTTPTAGVQSYFTVRLHNAGHLPQSSYTVKLMQAGTEGSDTELASQELSGQEIASGQNAEVRFAWTPSAAETVNLYGKVILNGDVNPANDQTGNLPVTVQPEGSLIISIGTGTATSYLPCNLFYRKSLSQTIYYPHEIGMIGGEISKIVYSARIASTGAVNDNIQNVPIQVWIGETSAADLSAGYVDPSTLTLVYDGVKSFPNGNYDVEFELTQPYRYSGGNLVVYSYSNNTVYGGYQDKFASTEYPNSFRSRHSYGDNIPNVEHPGNLGEVYHGIPNTRFYATPNTMNTMGSLSGTITDSEEASIADATVQIAGTQYHAVTGADGAYHFPLMAAGEYTIQITKFGYHTETKTVTITAQANTTQDATMQLRSFFTVAGIVKQFDTGAAVASAVVTLNCENVHIYTATTAANGTFTFTENETVTALYEGMYSVLVTAGGMMDYTGQINVNANIANHEIVLYETLAPAVAPFAEVIDSKAVIEWLAPGSIPAFNSYIQYCVNDNVVWQVGSEGAYDITAAMRFTADDLEQRGIVTGHSISKIAVGVASNIDNITAVELRIWEGGTSVADAGELVYTQAVTSYASFTGNAMNEIALTEPFVIDTSKELRIGWRVTGTSGYPVGFDEGPGVEGKSALINTGNAWQDAVYITDLNRNASIKAFVTNSPNGKNSLLLPVTQSSSLSGMSTQSTLSPSSQTPFPQTAFTAPKGTVPYTRSEAFTTPEGNSSLPTKGASHYPRREHLTTLAGKHSPHPLQTSVEDVLTETARSESKGFEKYVVYRLREGQPETEWTLLAADVTALDYTDETYSEQPYGVYQYAVKAQYTGERLSPAALTNRLAKEMEVDYTVNITLNTGELPSGATVTLINHDGVPEHRYTQTANENSVVFNAVWRGVYNLTVSLNDFQPYAVNDIEINAGGLSHTAQLTEILYPVVEPLAEIINYSAVVAWNEPCTFGEWLRWSTTDEIIAGTSGDPAGDDNLTAAIRFTAQDLSDFGAVNGQYITKVALGVAHPGQVSQMAVQIWEGGTSVTDAGELVYTQEVTGYESFTEYTWVEIPLTTPFPIDPSKELRIGWQVTTTSGSAAIQGHDASGSAAEWNEKTALFKSNYWGGIWRDISQLLGGQFNNAIKAFVSNSPDGKSATPLTHRVEAATSATKAHTGYAVYRLKEGDPETAWTQLGFATDTAYTDTAWLTLPDGNYQYAVKARYAGNLLSEAVLTNLLVKENIPCTISLSANPTAGGNVTGDGTYNEGVEITVTATPAAHYTFVNWTEDGIEVTDAAAEYTFTVTSDRTLVANFALEQFEVTFNAPENGTLTVTADSETVASGGKVDYNTDLVITATPDEGYKPESLTVNGVAFASGGTHTVVGNVNIECTFTDNVGINGNTLANITVYSNGNTVYIVNKNSVTLKLVQIIDVLGRVVYSGKASSSVTIPINGASGIYVVKLISDDNKTSSTKVHLTR